MSTPSEAKTNVLIGFDGSECAEAAVRDLKRAGLPSAVDATVLCIADLPVDIPFADYGAPGSPVFSRAAVEEVRELSAAAVADARRTSARGGDIVASQFPDWTVHAEGVTGSPYWTLVTRAERSAADLVVVGSHGRALIGRLCLGSVSQNVLHHAACSVRIGRRAGLVPAERAPVRIVLAVDGSTDAALAAETVRTRAWPAGTEVRVVTAVDTKAAAGLVWFGPWPERAEPQHDVAAIAQFRARAVAKALEETGLSATPVVLDGDPKRAVVDDAEQWAADCIFVGAKGHSRLDRFLLGSVSSAVATRAHCSVEVVRHRPTPAAAATA